MPVSLVWWPNPGLQECFENVWDATILAGGMSMQRAPVTTKLTTSAPLLPTSVSASAVWPCSSQNTETALMSYYETFLFI